MAKAPKQTVLFLGSTNFARDRFAQIYFDSVAGKMGLPWQALSRGLHLDSKPHQKGVIASAVLQRCKALSIHSHPDFTRSPQIVTKEDLETATRIVSLQKSTHEPIIADQFPEFLTRVEFWEIGNQDDFFGEVETEISNLIARILGGGERASKPVTGEKATLPQPTKPAKKPILKLGRETKGRRGKGVTIISDIPLSAEKIEELATQLKQKVGTGGTVKDGHIEIQGDQRERLTVELEKLGYQVKRVGG